MSNPAGQTASAGTPAPAVPTAATSVVLGDRPLTFEDVDGYPLEEIDTDLTTIFDAATAKASSKRVARDFNKVARVPVGVITVGYGAISGVGVLIAGGVDPVTAAALLAGGSVTAAVAKWWKPTAVQERNATARVRWQQLAKSAALVRKRVFRTEDDKRRAYVDVSNRFFELKKIDNDEREADQAESSV